MSQAVPAVQPVDRMIIYTTQLTLVVKDLERATSELGAIAAMHGGYLAGVENGSAGGNPMTIVKIKLLPERYSQAMSQIRTLAGNAVDVRNEKATTEDVTEEYADVQVQITSLEATHRQLVEIMSKATDMDQLLKVQAQAAQIQLQIDRLRGRSAVLERLSSLATITIMLQPAGPTLSNDFITVRGQLRQAQAQYAVQQIALLKARTPEEQSAVRDKLAELQLQIDRSQVRLAEITDKATLASVVLPTSAPEDATLVAAPEKDLPSQFVAVRVALRRAEAAKAELMSQVRPGLAPERQEALQKSLQERILETNSLNAQLKAVQERASQLGVTLPTLSAAEEAALAGTTVVSDQPDPLQSITEAWAGSLAFLRTALITLVSAVVFLWWAVLIAIVAALFARRRGLHLPWRGHPTPPSP